MTNPSLGSIQKVELRDIWPNEARDFTPWLEGNLPALNETLGMDLEIRRREAPVGDFSLDLLAHDLGSGRTVVIENQLTVSDHRHFGQLLMYASGFDADVVVWLAREIREEHRQALDWLNQRTDESTAFFGVVVELLKIDDSRPAPNFRLVAFPNEWRKTHITGGDGPVAVSPRSESYRDFFQQIIDELRDVHQFTMARKAQPNNWYAFSSGFNGFGYGASFAQGNRARVELYIDRPDKEWNKSIFDQLREDSKAFQSKFPEEELSWERLENNRACRIAVYRPGSILDGEDTIREISQWTVERLLTFKEVFGPSLAALAKP